MIPKSGYRFSEKIMLKQRYLSGAPAQASIQGAPGSGHAKAVIGSASKRVVRAVWRRAPAGRHGTVRAFFRRSVQRPALENAINKRNREHVPIPQEPDMR